MARESAGGIAEANFRLWLAVNRYNSGRGSYALPFENVIALGGKKSNFFFV